MRRNLIYPKNIRGSSNDEELYRFNEEKRSRRGEPFSLLGGMFRAVLLCFFRRLARTYIGLGSVIGPINMIASVSPTWSFRYSVEPFSLLTHF